MSKLTSILERSQTTSDTGELRGMLAEVIESAVALESQAEAGKQRLDAALKQLEDQERLMVEAQSHLIHSEKMAALGTLVTGVAHELNNPANFTYNGALNLENYLRELQEFLNELTEGDDEVITMFSQKFEPVFRNLGAIVDGTRRIQTIVSDLRTFSRLDEAEQKQADVLEGLFLTLTLVQAAYKEDVEFVTEFDDVPMLWCWPTQLNQVYMNLIVNACQAILARKEKEPSHKGKLVIQTVEEGPWLVLRFTDNGIGMSDRVLHRIFEPFFTTRSEGEGTGLGLSISYGIIEKHLGKFSVTSQEGEGSTFEVRLPIKYLSQEIIIPQELDSFTS